MSIQNRPYAGTWVANRRTVVQWTPDFLLYLNGDTSLPGCRTCHHNINIQEFVNSISCDFGVEPGASNCSISMAIPRHYGDSIFRDGNTLLRPGLEVHIYFRGYFPMKGMTTPNARPVAGINLADIPQYPYYPVFHGVVVNVTHEYSSGFYTASMSCNGMLHFWEHQKLSGAGGGAFFGARPANSGVQTTLSGHPMTGKSPYSIIYSLYRDTAGIADGVGFALSSRTNYGAVNSSTNDPLYAMTLRYWEQRFRGKMYGLRMHGASGQLFSSAQQAYLSLYGTNTFGGHAGTANPSGSLTGAQGADLFAQDPTLLLGLRARGADGRVLRQADTRLAGGVSNSGRFGLDVAQLQAFPADLGVLGQVNLFESTYESKMDIAGAVVGVCGYEFYQDADGDLVFKPPMYNLDTSSSRVYRLEPEDIVSINFTEAEPAATYVIVKGGAFQNMRGVVDESEWGCRSTYIDYKLVSQFGWIESSIESTYFTNAKSAFFFAINHLDRTNAGTNGCTVTIPLRPEIRPGYPVYIPHIDCFYYVTQVAHAFNLGSECTTSLTLTARRRKFLPPGNTSTNVSIDQNLSQIDLAATNNPIRALHTLDNSGCPRIIGFPNVVMAIDPTTINPMFQSIGFQAVERELSVSSTRAQQGESSNTVHADVRDHRSIFVWQFIRMMLSRVPPMLRPEGQDTTGDVMTPPVTDDFLTRNINQRFSVTNIPGVDQPITVVFRDIADALDQYIITRSMARRAKAILVHMLVEKQNEIHEAEARAFAAARQSGNDSSTTTPAPQQSETANWYQTTTGIQQKINELDANFDIAPTANSLSSYATQYNDLATVVNQVGARPGSGSGRNRLHINNQTSTAGRENNVILLSAMFGQFRTSGPQTSDIRTDPSGTINGTANLLDMMSDRKASLNLTVPGYYRYYSASHPNPAMQGYADVSRSISEDAPVVEQDGRPAGAVTIVNYRPTPTTPEQAAVYLRDAWRSTHGGQSPSTNELALALSQWREETGDGRSMFNNNFGGVKATRSGERARVFSPRANNSAWFQSYSTPEEGARHFVWRITSGSYVGAIAQYNRALARGYPAAATAYADSIGRSGYLGTNPPPGKIERYGRDLGNLLPSSRRIVERAGLADTGQTSRGDRDPAATPRTPQSPATIPDSEISTVVVQPMTDESGIPPERKGQYVEVVPEHIPRKGLEVRVLEDDSTRVLPTNLIYSMTFESRRQQQVTNAMVNQFNPANPTQLAQFVEQCLTNGGGQFAVALTMTFSTRVGSDGRTRSRPTVESIQELITVATEGITGLRNAEGLIAASPTILNITNGAPNNFNPSDITVINGSDNGGDADRILTAKAKDLVKEVTRANQASLEDAIRQIRALPRRQALTAAIDALLAPWREDLLILFQGNPIPVIGPFQPQRGVQLVTSTNAQFSPVFPVSDAKGFEHYGAYQYGRGLSIEPGGNYERLMANNPLQYLSDAQIERLLRSLRSNPNNPARRRAELVGTMASFANDPEFRSGLGAQAILEYQENDQTNSDRTTMLANRLANYIMSDRDAVMKLPVNNSAYRLADLQPMGQEDACGCRGVEADLLLAAYMAGTENFTIIDSQDEAMNWVAGQMSQAAGAWSEVQSRMRGMSMGAGRRSLLDRVEGWETIANQYRSANQGGANQLGAVGSQAEVVAARTDALFQRPLVPPRGQ